MNTMLNRRDIGYTLISRFEEAFRSFIAAKIVSLFDTYSSGIPAGVIQKAKERAGDQTWNEALDFLDDIDFPDLREIVCFQKMYGSYFPNVSVSQADFERLMDELYELRCKIAHVKQHFSAFDLDRLLESSTEVASILEDAGMEFLSFSRIIVERPEDVVIKPPMSFFESITVQEVIPNNVPIPDYEYEGGFVGRVDDTRKIRALLEGRRNVITITGAGGVGKTALALRVTLQLLEANAPIFDGIVWLSAKENMLSYLGIEDIEPTVRNYEELLDSIFEVMGFNNPPNELEQKEQDIAIIFELYPRILIVIDNFETITDDRIVIG